MRLGQKRGLTPRLEGKPGGRDWMFSSGHRGVQEGHLCPWEANWQVPAVMG